MRDKFQEWIGNYATDGTDRIFINNVKVNQGLYDAFAAGYNCGKRKEWLQKELQEIIDKMETFITKTKDTEKETP